MSSILQNFSSFILCSISVWGQEGVVLYFLKCCDKKSFHISLEHFQNYLTINNLRKVTPSLRAIFALLSLVLIQYWWTCHPIQSSTLWAQAAPWYMGPVRAGRYSIIYIGDFCILFISFNKINAAREAASKSETFLT